MDPFATIEVDLLLRYAIALVVVFSTLAMIWYSIWWGFLMILSAWKEDKVKSAVNHIRHALIWLWFLLIVLYTFPLLAWFAWFAYPESIKPSSIFSSIRELSEKIFDVDLDSSSDFTPSSIPESTTDSDFTNL